jgi:GT2 family glycosyltransferase
MKVAILIPIFNGLDFTKKALKEIFLQIEGLKDNTVGFQVIVIDDGSSDGSSDWIKSNFPQVKIAKGDGNLWWSGSINEGARMAFKDSETTHVLWWNNDIVPAADYFSNLSGILKNLDDNVIIGSKIYVAENPGEIWAMGGKFDPVKGVKDMIAFHVKDSSEYQSVIDVQWLPGMGTVVPKMAFDKIGFLDDINFPQYHGDSDYTYRAFRNGFRIKVYPELKIFNSTGNTGMKYPETFSQLKESLGSLKSNYNIKKDFMFYKIHSQSPLAYKVLLKKYFEYTGGFFKWKTLGLIGMKRKVKL